MALISPAEPLKDVGQEFGINTFAVVSDAYFNLVYQKLYGDGNAAVSGMAVGVIEQIDQHLNQTVGIAIYMRQVGIGRNSQGIAKSGGKRLESPCRGFYQGIGREAVVFSPNVTKLSFYPSSAVNCPFAIYGTLFLEYRSFCDTSINIPQTVDVFSEL